MYQYNVNIVALTVNVKRWIDMKAYRYNVLVVMGNWARNQTVRLQAQAIGSLNASDPLPRWAGHPLMRRRSR